MDGPMGLTSTDPLTDLLNGVRTSGAIFNQSSLSGSWAVRFEDGSPLALAVLLQGSAWITPQGGDPVRLGPGDVAVLCGGAPYVIANAPATEPDVMIRPDGCCTTAQGAELVDAQVPDAGTWDTAGADSTLLLSGLYTVDCGTPGRLLAALPPLAVIEANVGACPVSPTTFEEITREEPGQQILLDRTLDLMLITALRAWFTRPGAQVPTWYRAHSDPVVGPALRLLQTNPAHPWTLPALAAEAGASRANLARRFTALVGQPPMTYLRERRLALAADLLRAPGATLTEVADRVGFSNAFSLSAAFKREHGVSPSEYRTDTARTEP
ncbi:AraC family transcriptional regulator [Streptomyces viridochromogenes]|uniref:AraC family transcriptional regulator n=1 Tax=Streptomyces viridochromogenes TaxID=1938 RepID=A0A0J7ZA35_STRVR|nr:AraC family transcriptional regulator [Streptomyces viridochromogenes]KMS72332.1 AraC family transcriptional regulator [Streptomyces viridochromogenes]